MPCFNGNTKRIKKITGCPNSNIPDELNPNCMIRRRFGITQDNIPVEFDLYGEPIEICDGLTENPYNDLKIYGDVTKRKLSNDDDSKIGGRDDDMRQLLQINFPSDTDVKKNDVLLYPVGSGDSYIVRDMYYSGVTNEIIRVIAYSEVRQNK